MAIFGHTKHFGRRPPRLGRAARGLISGAALTLAVAAIGGSLAGCAVSEDDVHRWETTQQGPRKLYAVVTHDKYDWNLRVEAAMSLARTKPRDGKTVSIPFLIDGYKDDEEQHRDGALIALDADTRAKMIAAMAPPLIAEIQKPAPEVSADGTVPPDDSIHYKDVAFALLHHEPPLVQDAKVKSDIEDAIVAWCMTNFEVRMGLTGQQYGVEQMLRFLGPHAVRGLPEKISADSTRLDRIAALIADVGEPATKTKAAQAFVALANEIDSDAWIAKQKPIVEEANKRAGQNVPPERVAEQIKKFQDQELTKIYAAMKKVGGRPVVEHLIAYAADPKRPDDRRKAALAALEGRVDKNSQQDIDRLFGIAKNDATPDEVRDLAFRRLGELPKEIVVPKMYQLFGTNTWKVRWVAASLVLKTLTTGKIGPFMGRLPANASTKMGMTEPISYARIIKSMDHPGREPEPWKALRPYLASRDLGPKLVALSFYYGGRAADANAVRKYAKDKMAVPKCGEKDECGWSCSEGGKEYEIHTVGEYVEHCIVPSMKGK